MDRIDLLMITYNRPAYTQQALDHLLETASPETRVWIWHNGNDADTLAVVRERASHPRVHQFHHSPENVRLQEPTNWLWQSSDAPLLGKVDDDCLLDAGWDATFAAAHRREPSLGVIGAWRFYDEDFIPQFANRKTVTLPGGTTIMRNPWVQGSGYLVKRQCVVEHRLLNDSQGAFTQWCVELALRGWQNGWHLPFVHEEHMDDPRSPYTAITSDATLRENLPLSAQRLGIRTVADWEARMRESARELQRLSDDPRNYVGWRGRLYRRQNAWRRRLRRQGVAPRPSGDRASGR